MGKDILDYNGLWQKTNLIFIKQLKYAGSALDSEGITMKKRDSDLMELA